MSSQSNPCLQTLANPRGFSPGWVAYSVAALVSAVGENKLMPLAPDCRCKVIHGRSGYSRDNSSWILGRIVRDFDYWKDNKVTTKLQQVLTDRHNQLKAEQPDAEKPSMAGLIVSIYEPSTTIAAGTVKRDHVFWTGPPIIFAQFVIAFLAFGVYGEWGTLLITTAGTALALVTGQLSQWKREKWTCREKSKGSYILTRGNGSQHAIIVRGNGHGFNLEDLASGQANVTVAASSCARFELLILAICWVLLLITAAGLKQKTWFLLGVGTVGILGNIYVAGAARRPESFGIPLDFVEVLGNIKVMKVLLELERKYQYVGQALLEEFFPGPLRAEEMAEWAEIKRNYAETAKGNKDSCTSKAQ